MFRAPLVILLAGQPALDLALNSHTISIAGTCHN